MIDLIIGIFTGIKNLLYYALLLSYEVGKLIVKLGLISLCVLQYIYEICQTVTTVICEDFLIFLYDVYNYTVCGIHFINNTFGSMYNFMHNSIEYVKYYVIYGKEVISSSLYSVLSGHLKLLSMIGQIIIGIKQLFILLGAGVWFLLTLIPLSIIYSFSMITYYIGCCLEEIIVFVSLIFKPIFRFVQDMIDFTFDVPLEATAGLIAGSCIVYLIIKFHMMAYYFLKEQFTMLLRYTRVLIRNKLRKRNVPPQRMVKQPSPRNGLRATPNRDLNCVICQEREKCILILPCKHMCLCSECKDELYRFHSRCPICRSYVHRTMKVFV